MKHVPMSIAQQTMRLAYVAPYTEVVHMTISDSFLAAVSLESAGATDASEADAKKYDFYWDPVGDWEDEDTFTQPDDASSVWK